MAGVSAVYTVQPTPQKARAEAVAAEPKPKIATDRYESTKPSRKLPPHPAAVHMRNGIFEVLGGAVLTAGGVVGLAMTAGAASIALPILFGVAAAGGAALMAKGVHDYGKGIAELIVELILLPFRFIEEFTGK